MKQEGTFANFLFSHMNARTFSKYCAVLGQLDGAQMAASVATARRRLDAAQYDVCLAMVLKKGGGPPLTETKTVEAPPPRSSNRSPSHPPSRPIPTLHGSVSIPLKAPVVKANLKITAPLKKRTRSVEPDMKEVVAAPPPPARREMPPPVVAPKDGEVLPCPGVVRCSWCESTRDLKEVHHSGWVIVPEDDDKWMELCYLTKDLKHNRHTPTQSEIRDIMRLVFMCYKCEKKERGIVTTTAPWVRESHKMYDHQDHRGNGRGRGRRY